MTGPEGKLFKPLAYTKSFALIGSVIVALLVVPALAHIFFAKKSQLSDELRLKFKLLISLVCVFIGWKVHYFLGLGILLYSLYRLLEKKIPLNIRKIFAKYSNWIAVGIVLLFLTYKWMPLGIGKGFILNVFFVSFCIFTLIFSFFKFLHYYPKILMYFLNNKKQFFIIPISIVLLGLTIWLGFAKITSLITKPLNKAGVSESFITHLLPIRIMSNIFPGLGKEFMPPLDEGSYLYMPTTMPHASIAKYKNKSNS